RDLLEHAAFADSFECDPITFWTSEITWHGVAHMVRAAFRLVVGLTIALSIDHAAVRADEPSFKRAEDVIYGRKLGTALTMDIFTPQKQAQNIGVIIVVSGGFRSSHDAINAAFIRPLTDRGFTTFAVVHGSQPRFTVPEIIQDVNRAVRFIRYHAKDYR